MIGIIDYGLGNVRAFLNVYRRLGVPVKLVSSKGELKNVDRLILPGVGSFDWAMKRLNVSGMRSALDTLVLQHGVPVLGVCVGMQTMAIESEGGRAWLGRMLGCLVWGSRR